MKRAQGLTGALGATAFSAAVCRGLIEARRPGTTLRDGGRRFPRLYAAASLKPGPTELLCADGHGCFPRLYAAASLKRSTQRCRCSCLTRFPRLYAAASLKHPGLVCPGFGCSRRFPRLYAAASLKHDTPIWARGKTGCFPRLYAAASLKPLLPRDAARPGRAFSAAVCRGLIEAASSAAHHLQ